ncbi:MAG: hypothetical protein HRT61_23775, partial [Ekhidna sp.]|nr:hypothetical protein [Ekhidna sp.]
MKSLQRILFVGFIFLGFCARAQVTEAEYFFDDDPGTGNGTAISITAGESLDVSFSADVTGLSPGFHRLFVRVKDDVENWGLFEGRTFYVQDNTAEVQPTAVATAEYFFDTDPGEGNGTAITLTSGDNLDVAFEADASGLDPGFHRLFVRVQDDLGLWSLFEGR